MYKLYLIVIYTYIALSIVDHVSFLSINCIRHKFLYFDLNWS